MGDPTQKLPDSAYFLIRLSVFQRTSQRFNVLAGCVDGNFVKAVSGYASYINFVIPTINLLAAGFVLIIGRYSSVKVLNW